MNVPPVFSVDDLTPAIIEDLRDASATYCEYDYTGAFDDLMMLPKRAETIAGFLAGSVAGIHLAKSLREWLLKPWSSTRTLGHGRMQAVGDALQDIRATMAAISTGPSIEDADRAMFARMVDVFTRLDDCPGVGPTIASKILAPLHPAWFPMWDNAIAEAYGFALNAAGYRQYLTVTQAIARKAREFWHSADPLEPYLKPERRRWTAPLAKVMDEWNWIRITRGHVFCGH